MFSVGRKKYHSEIELILEFVSNYFISTVIGFRVFNSHKQNLPKHFPLADCQIIYFEFKPLQIEVSVSNFPLICPLLSDALPKFVVDSALSQQGLVPTNLN